MRKFLFAVAVWCAAGLAVSSAYAQDEEKESKKPVVTKRIVTQKSAQTAAPAVSEQEAAVIMQQATQSLTGQSWTVYWSEQGLNRPAVITDVLTFTDTGVSSQYLTSKGFGGSNYAMHVTDDRAAVWETVQRNANDDLAAWRGELRGGEIFGTVSIRDHDTGKTVLYSYSTGRPAPAAAGKK